MSFVSILWFVKNQYPFTLPVLPALVEMDENSLSFAFLPHLTSKEFRWILDDVLCALAHVGIAHVSTML